MKCDVLIVGGGTGGVAAALALAGKGLSVILTEETDWLGGQLTSQIVPPDEHPWIEQFGCTFRYRKLRLRTRFEFRSEGWVSASLLGDIMYDPLTNPGGGWVSRLCAQPRHFLKAVQNAMRPAGSMGQWLSKVTRQGACEVFLQAVATECRTDGYTVFAVRVQSASSGLDEWVEPRFVLDATELGDLLPMTGTAYVTGAESKQDTGEPHALDGPAEPDNVQAFTWCAAIGYDPDGDHTIRKPDQYDFWRSYVPPHWTGNLLDLTFPNVRTGAPMTLPLFSPPPTPSSSSGTNIPLDEEGASTLFGYRQIVDPSQYIKKTEAVTVMNWPQNDYMLGHVIDVDAATRDKHYEGAKQLTLSVLYWLQTEMGFKGLRLRPDITGTPDGLAKAPYHRESRRIRALRTIKEQDVSPDCNPGSQVAPEMWDSVGVGAYRIDLHPSANGGKTIDIGCLPFQIPLGALIPEKTTNLLPACKNIGTTHITNGCYRLHPVEWNIGESAGLLAFFCLTKNLTPQEVYADKALVKEYQELLVNEGVELAWPKLGPL